jgi:Tol biopolymer transport system component
VNACPVVQATPWKFKRVWGDPVFSPDGTAILFNAYNDCGLIQASSKPHTNILMLDLSAVGDGTPFEETDFVNLTKNPKGDGAENLVIDSFDISLTGKTIAFSATPMYSKGQPADPDRANKDKEIWLIGVGGTGKTQLTDDAKYLAKGPMMLDPAIFQAFSNPQ